MLHPNYYVEKAKQDEIINRKNEVDTSFYNGIYDRFKYPVLTRDNIPLFWRFDLDTKTNPRFMERLGINAVFNAGAIEHNGKYYIVLQEKRKNFQN